MKKIIYPRPCIALFSAFLLFSVFMRAQTNLKPPLLKSMELPHCGSTLPTDPADISKMNAFEQSMYSRLAGGSNIATTADTEQYTLSVVFHIINQGGPENIPDQDVLDAVVLLNQAFSETAPFDPSLGVPVDIDFCLGNTAITRHTSPLTNIVMENDDAALKQIGTWNPLAYINIWVVNSINSQAMGPGVAGYAMLPYAHGSPVDGIVIEADFVNNNPDDVKVLVHEVGHYLGLYHTFEGGCQNNDCHMDGDKVCDTPPDNSIAALPCQNSANTCHTDEDDPSADNPFRAVSLGGIGDQPDMHQNYMDYGFQTCQNAFTDGQRTRMRDALRTIRNSLIDSPGACSQCTDPVIASLNLPGTLPAGVAATFSVTTGSPVTQIIWIVNGQVQIGPTFTITIDVTQSVPVQVIVVGTGAGCNKTLHDTVNFVCPVPQPVFTINPSGLINPGQVVTFSTVNNGFTYTWAEDGVAVGSGTPFNYTANGNYGRLITLEASNGTCKAVSEPQQLIPGNCNNSKENNVWYFGMGGGVNFNTNPPQTMLGRINTQEGCAVLCDASGNALFHSNGENVGNSSTGNVLLNGSGLTGDQTTTQSALFVPQPGNNQFVYLFTVAPQAGDYTAYGGIYYSIIDKLGDNGNGAVTAKNQLLISPVVEKVTAIKNLAGNGIWVIAHLWHSDAFYSWLVTSTGISAPVVSHVGVTHTSPGYSYYYALGEMKASPSGKKIALAMSAPGLYQVFDFNNATGMLSNAITLQDASLTQYAYGVAFSPNERYLYATSTSNKIHRFDLSAPGQASILASAVLITSGNGEGGSIQLGPNGKIYTSRRGSYYLGVISNPNALNPANCGYVANGLKLADYTSCFYGLPNPVQSALASVDPVITGPDKICLNGPPVNAQYSFDPIGTATYTWIHHGPNSFIAVNDSTAGIQFSNPGTDTLIVMRDAICGDSFDTLFIYANGPVETLDLGPDHLVCRGTNVSLNAGAGFYQYSWSSGGAPYEATNVNDSGLVVAEVITQSGCVLRDSVEIRYYGVPLELGEDTSICSPQTITLAAPAGMNSYLWSNAATTPSITVSDSGIYVVTVSKYGCLFLDTIHVRKNIVQDVFATDTVIICLVGPATFTAPSGFDDYMWTYPSGGQTDSITITPLVDGYYVLDYSNLCGAGRDSIYRFRPRIFATDTIVSCADTLDLQGNGEFLNGGIQLLDYSIHGDTLSMYQSGDYVMLAAYPDLQSTCLIHQYIHVYLDTVFTPPALSVDLGNDTSFCDGHILPLNATGSFDSYHWNTGSWDSHITAYGFGTYYVDAYYCGYTFSDTIHITQEDPNNCIVSLADTKSSGCGFTLSPNPGTDHITISSACQVNELIRVSVYAADGKSIASAEVKGLEDTNRFLNDLMPKLQSAMYTLRLDLNRERYHFKWIILK
ncbi:MAG: hypothetical protein K0S33_1665 [Bacteroidetes bacterium]|jgi:hypothetical protein|nr:hypothetical protein [Bacteroidota bacterium]